MSSPTTPPPRIELAHVTVRHGDVRALDDVSLVVDGGGWLALVGESGAGKSTLLRCINRLVEPSAGTVTIDGVPVSARDPVALRRSVGFVPQDGGLLPHWRAWRNAALVPWLLGRREARPLAERALARAGLDPGTMGERWPHELSGGERQRVAVARALAGGQSLLLLDEPFGALDAITRSDLQRMLLDLRRGDGGGLTMVLVTHDLREALLLADRVAVLRAGRLEQVADAGALAAAPATPYVAALLARAGVAA
ncbi:MAG TPA: ATP-binding cassette domain-containing protein [Gemmatimonadaceae bacterium]